MLKLTPIPVPTESCCRKRRKRKRIQPRGLKSPHQSMNAANATDAHLKKKCIRACGSKKPLEERHKVIYVSKRFARQRQAMEAKISSPKGCLLRVNRSIQAEGNFAYVKQDLDFRRFLLRGSTKVAAEWLLFSLALNILHLHHKIQNRRLGSGLKIPSSFPCRFITHSTWKFLMKIIP